jgi:predicted transcriptional regulator
LIEASAAFLTKLKAGEEFSVKAFNKHMLKERWGEPSAYRAINEEMAAGTIKRVSKGKYQRTASKFGQVA